MPARSHILEKSNYNEVQHLGKNHTRHKMPSQYYNLKNLPKQNDVPKNLSSSSCQTPQKSYSWALFHMQINLECTQGDYKQQNLTKYVQLIHDCTCGSCSEQLARPTLTNPQEFEDLDKQNLGSDLAEEPSTLDETADILRQPTSNSSSATTAGFKGWVESVYTYRQNWWHLVEVFVIYLRKWNEFYFL